MDALGHYWSNFPRDEIIVDRSEVGLKRVLKTCKIFDLHKLLDKLDKPILFCA